MRRKTIAVGIILALIVFAHFVDPVSAGYRRAARSCGISRAEFRASNPKPLGLIGRIVYQLTGYVPRGRTP